MSPVEIEFLYFLPAVLLLYWIGPRWVAWQNTVLLVASYVFFLSWNGRLLTILVAMTTINFLIARAIARGPVAGEEGGTGGSRRLLFWTGVTLNLLELAAFKYEGFFASGLNRVLAQVGIGGLLPVLGAVPVVGLSFRVLQNIGYLADVYVGREEAHRSLLDFALFAAFFPQMLAGPIARGHQMLPQYARPRLADPAQWASGAATILLGFTLKAFSADVIGSKLVNPVFSAPDVFNVTSHWIALAGFALQVFADFGGYSLIAIGIGRLVGLELPINFNFPFTSLSLPELWRRWHITLNTWLFDYIFVPLTVSSKWLRGRIIPAFFVTFGLSGLWHGAAWTFVLWGILQALGLSAHYLWDERYKKLCRKDRVWVKRRQTAVYKLFSWVLTQGFFVLTLIPFRATSMSGVAEYARHMLRAAGTEMVPLANPQLAMALVVVLAYQLVPFGAGARLWRRFEAMPPVVRGLAYGLVLAFLLIMTPQGSGTFLYAQY